MVYTPQITFTWSDFVQNPSCNYALNYNFELVSQSNGSRIALPAWITSTGFDFDVYTTDPSTIDDYYVAVTGSVPLTFPAFSDEL